MKTFVAILRSLFALLTAASVLAAPLATGLAAPCTFGVHSTALPPACCRASACHSAGCPVANSCEHPDMPILATTDDVGFSDYFGIAASPLVVIPPPTHPAVETTLRVAPLTTLLSTLIAQYTCLRV